MNSNPYILPALIVIAAVLFFCAACIYLSVTQPSGQHARRREPNAEGARFGAYLRGEDPGEQPAAPEPGDPADAGWWDVPPPPAGCIVVRQPQPVPSAPRWRGGASLTLLARVRDKLLPDAWRPEPGQATFTPAGPDDTCTDLPAVQDAPQYLAAPQ